MKMNQSAAFKLAKELTIAAIEHSMIPATTDPKETAKNIVDFYNEMADSFTDPQSE